LALARDKRTFGANLKVRADAGVVTVNYRPQDASIARFVSSVLESVPGIRDLRITMATANLLWIQEEFKPRSDVYTKVVEIATKWNAAVELLRLAPERPEGEDALTEGAPASANGFPADSIPEAEDGAPVLEAAGEAPPAYDGGIELDDAEVEEDDGGLQPTLDELAHAGRSGGGRSVFGSRQRLVESLDRTFPYTLVVVGDVFLSKGQAARLRATRDLRSFLEDRIRAPVVTAEELETEFLFGKRDVIRAGVYLSIIVLIFFLVFTNQEFVLAFLNNTGWYADAVAGTFLGRFEWLPKALVSLLVFLFIPIVAYSYGRVASTFLKLIKME
jgi:hypothetical protein